MISVTFLKKGLGSWPLFLLVLLFVGMQDLIAQQPSECACDEYLYLNDFETDVIHKFRVNQDGSTTEIGNPWATGINNPHGIGLDPNGFLYVAELSGETHRLNCDCLLYTSPSPRDGLLSRMPSSA